MTLIRETGAFLRTVAWLVIAGVAVLVAQLLDWALDAHRDPVKKLDPIDGGRAHPQTVA